MDVTKRAFGEDSGPTVPRSYQHHRSRLEGFSIAPLAALLINNDCVCLIFSSVCKARDKTFYLSRYFSKRNLLIRSGPLFAERDKKGCYSYRYITSKGLKESACGVVEGV